MKIHKFDSLESTNTYLKDHIHDYNNHDVVFTFNQTKGHGRTNRIWTSNNDSLTFSILFKDQFIYDNFESLSIISATSVYQILSKRLKNVKIKWPNDIIVNDKKICGILLETRISSKIEGLILGIGLNVNNKNFDSSLNATSLYLETQKEENIDSLLLEIVQQILENIELLKIGKSNHIEIINQNNYLLNKQAYAYINNKKEKVTVLHILENNHLVVLLNGKEKEILHDEISFHKD